MSFGDVGTSTATLAFREHSHLTECASRSLRDAVAATFALRLGWWPCPVNHPRWVTT